MRKTKAPFRKSSLAVATFLVVIATLVDADLAAAEASTAQKEPSSPRDDEERVDKNREYLEHCHVWPVAGCPPEHRDAACDLPRQNARLAEAEAVAQAARPEDLIPDAVYLSLPEERTWACPLDATGEGAFAGATGKPTRWILHNAATTPVVLSHVNALGLEVSALDFRTHPAHADTAVFPHGPIVPPGQVAVIDGRQGQLFVAREYREVLPMDAMLAAAEDDGEGHSWASFKQALPPTLSFLPEQARYKTGKGVWHILGKPGRVLMKHRMGNIHVRNQFGAVCPVAAGSPPANDTHPAGATANDGRRSPPGKDMYPACNVVQKAFLNAVGCPVDLYFAPRNRVDGYDCERFQLHLSARATYMASADPAKHLDDHASPLKFPNTYNGHTFVARMAHDQALVAQIEVDHDVVRDCPAPARGGVSARAGAPVLQGAAFHLVATNATAAADASNEWLVGSRANATSPPVLSGKFLQAKYDLVWKNSTGIMSAAVPIAS